MDIAARAFAVTAGVTVVAIVAEIVLTVVAIVADWIISGSGDRDKIVLTVDATVADYIICACPTIAILCRLLRTKCYSSSPPSKTQMSPYRAYPRGYEPTGTGAVIGIAVH